MEITLTLANHPLRHVQKFSPPRPKMKSAQNTLKHGKNYVLGTLKNLSLKSKIFRPPSAPGLVQNFLPPFSRRPISLAPLYFPAPQDK